MNEVYRGDNRAPDALRASDGFRAWVQPDPAQARDLIRLFSQQRTVGACNFYPTLVEQRHMILPEGWTAASTFKPLDLPRLIISSGRSRTTFWISTELTDGGGGMGGTNIYRIGTADLKPVPWASVGYRGKVTSLDPTLLMDDADLDRAQRIAIQAKGAGDYQEVSFVTPVLYAQIDAYKAAGSSTWTPMP